VRMASERRVFFMRVAWSGEDRIVVLKAVENRLQKYRHPGRKSQSHFMPRTH
jgi:hypothetical protein